MATKCFRELKQTMSREPEGLNSRKKHVDVTAQSHRHKSFHRFLAMVFLMEKKEMLAEIKEKTNAIIIKEFSQDGAMIQYNSSGEVKGKYHANHVETTDVKMKMDGTNEWETGPWK